MRIDMFIDVRANVRTDMRMDMRIDMRLDVGVEMRKKTGMDMITGMAKTRVLNNACAGACV